MDGWMEVKAVLRIAYSNQKFQIIIGVVIKQSANVCSLWKISWTV
jgi:hypothetical protein